jgi:hypothetical protein
VATGISLAEIRKKPEQIVLRGTMAEPVAEVACYLGDLRNSRSVLADAKRGVDSDAGTQLAVAAVLANSGWIEDARKLLDEAWSKRSSTDDTQASAVSLGFARVFARVRDYSRAREAMLGTNATDVLAAAAAIVEEHAKQSNPLCRTILQSDNFTDDLD